MKATVGMEMTEGNEMRKVQPVFKHKVAGKL